jgi:hypothetical protein
MYLSMNLSVSSEPLGGKLMYTSSNARICASCCHGSGVYSRKQRGTYTASRGNDSLYAVRKQNGSLVKAITSRKE